MLYFLDFNRPISLRNRFINSYQVIIISIVIVGINARELKKSCLPLDSAKELPPRHQSNAKLKIKPKIEIPIELTASVKTGITISLPIIVKFQSKFDLITNWLKQISTTASGVANSFTSLTAALTQLIGNIPPLLNVATTTTSSVSSSSASASSPANPTNDFINGISSYAAGASANNSNSNINGRNSDDKNFDKVLLLSKFANNTRAQSRAKFYKSIEISHSKLGKGCLLRAICEVAQTPLIAPNTGIIGEIIDMFLTISPLHSELPEFEDYLNAQTFGRNSFLRHSTVFRNYTFKDECRAQYGIECPFSLFNINHIIPIV